LSSSRSAPLGDPLGRAPRARREVIVGGSTSIVLFGNKPEAGLANRYLARTGYDGQQTEEPAAPARPGNLRRPVDDERDRGARRRDDRASDHGAQLWATTHRSRLLAAGAGVAGVAAAGAARLKRGR
jgi:hypothetical protein